MTDEPRAQFSDCYHPLIEEYVRDMKRLAAYLGPVVAEIEAEEEQRILDEASLLR